LSAAMPLAEEGLLAPFFVNGKAVGTIWVIAHRNHRNFDAEDQRLLESMGRFASAAYQTVESIEELKSEVVAREKVEAELRELTDSLERQVRARTRELEHRNEALAKARSELAHVSRVTGLGVLTASIAHEVNQPITAAVTYAEAALRWISAEPPDLGEVSEALTLIVKEGNRAGEVVARTRALTKKVPARKDAVAINDAILEVIALTRTEAANNGVLVRTQLAEGLPRVQGDRVQLQQVMLNLIVNAIQAMSGIGEGARELQISIDAVPSEGGVRVGVRDTGPGLSPESLSRLFEPFYTTKPEGMGMGLSICRSIIEAHGGRLWAIPCEPQGALFQFTIPAT
jgi:C4-dicarboxylate-specific signal transduction histidine kinase